MTTLVTGGTGFLGSHVARLLVERGDEVRIAVRERSKRENLKPLEGSYEPVTCDVLDRRQVRRAMKGVEQVFHLAGSTSLASGAGRALFELNVEGTKLVLSEARRAEVERVVHTSSVAAIGPARPGETADETQLFTAGRLGIPFVNSKHEAEVEALRLAAQGLPVVCVNPAFVFGAGDIYRSSTGIVRRFLLGAIPAYVDGGLNVVDVEDVARGHLLAAEKGGIGERYILGNRNYTLTRLFADLSRLSGVEAPPLKLPAETAVLMARALEAAPGRAPFSVDEVKAASQWWTFRSTKAKRELGWAPAPHEDTVEATVAWYLEREGERLRRSRRSQPFFYKVAGAAMNALRG
ncbi:MAG: SDR family NAD(P)-dependent oxidoreductase [Thermoleophilaceae bacterium]|nr:SDR family NAD(P)-dependent oxidoreductase [Thermoleophilaceae bacterium]